MLKLYLLGLTAGLIVLEGRSAVIQRSGDEPEHLLVANLDVPVTSDPLGRLPTVARPKHLA